MFLNARFDPVFDVFRVVSFSRVVRDDWHYTDHPHRLFAVTPDGRKTIGEQYRQGVDFGHGRCDFEGSSQHVFGVEVSARWPQYTYVEDPDHPGVEVVRYFDLDENRRLDLALLDADGDVVVAVEVERINNDVKRAVPEDFDKLASCDPDEAIWVVSKQQDGHKLLTALRDPPDGRPRVEREYAPTTPPQQFRIDTPGMTAFYPAEWHRDRVDDETGS